MLKVTINIPDEYLRQMNSSAKNINLEGTAGDMMMSILKAVTAKALLKEIEEGTTEINLDHIFEDKEKDAKLNEVLDTILPQFLSLYITMPRN